MAKLFYITAPIFYPNDRLHLGHAYTMVLADIMARYKRSQGYQVYFQTGSDDHGEKIEKKALSLGLTPPQLVDKNVLLFRQLWKELDISEHIFYRTSSPDHKEKVQKTFTKLLEQGDIYLGKYKGNYCITCEDYISKSKISKNGLCPFGHSELRIIEEPAYFLRISKYYPNLTEHYKKNPQFILPANIKKELEENFLKSGIQDLCITRQDIKWGISVPGNEKMVIYVWFEALLNYLNSEPGEKIFLSSKKNENKKFREFSCVVIKNKDNQCLLVYNKKFGYWQFPGGKIEANETPLEAAKREIFEETNLVVKELEKIGEEIFCVNNEWWKSYFFQTSKFSGEIKIKEKETIAEVKFFETSEIEEINSQNPDEVTEYLLERLTNKKIITHEIVQIIGKDIARFHGIYWPIILMILKARLPDKILAHGWLLRDWKKMSKSVGNIIDPLELLKKYPRDSLRAYFVAKINFLQDGILEENLLKDFYHDFLVNNLSNLVSRVNGMFCLYNKKMDLKIEIEVKNEKLAEYRKKCEITVKEFQAKMNKYELTNAFSQIQNLLNESNKLISDLAPWKLAEKGDISLLNLILNHLSNGIKIIAFLLNSIIPETSEKIFQNLGISQNHELQKLNWENLLNFIYFNKNSSSSNKHLYTKL
jgi:methionyl-tRNA synthetase